MNINKTTAWACASGRVIMPWSVRSTRREVIRHMTDNFNRPWSELKRQGNSTLKVEIIPCSTKGEGQEQ